MPTSPEIIRFADCTPQPWANGGGSTCVIAMHADDPKTGPFDWRLSVATVGSGDFSLFPGVDRVIVLVDGPTMELTIDGVARTLDPLRPRRFAGESMVSCVVSQQCLDFNVMTRREVCRADVSIRVGSGHVAAPVACMTFIVSLADSVTVHPADGGVKSLRRFDTMAIAAEVDVSTETGARLAVVRIEYADGRRLR